MDLPSYRRGFHNPFDRGPILNCLDVCGGSEDEWLDMHTVPERQQQQYGRRRSVVSELWWGGRTKGKNVYEMV